jgi:hypothetical protein
VRPADTLIPRTAGDPCSITLFDEVYRNLTTNHAAVICVGAGNDGLEAPFVINEVGQSPNVTIVTTALDPVSGGPASYSNYGLAPGGVNGHPDLAAPGTSGAPGFTWLLEGTSVATAFTSAMAAFMLSKNPGLSPSGVLSSLVQSGTPLPPAGNKLYGDAILKLPWAPVQPVIITAPAPPPPLLLANPNPARLHTRLTFDMEKAGEVEIRIFDAAGRLVRNLHHGHLAAGRHDIPFDGRAGNGAPVTAGIYLARIRKPGGTGTARLMIQP